MSEPNKCDLCGLKSRILETDLSDSVLSEENWKNFRDLQKKNIIPDGYPRIISVTVGGKHVPDHVDFCSIDSKAWNKINKKCDYFQLLNPKINLSDCVSIYTANKNARTSKYLSCVAIGIAFISLVVMLLIQVYQNKCVNGIFLN